jgi:hypothetical protein
MPVADIMAFNKSMAKRMEEQMKSLEMHLKERLVLKAIQLQIKEVEDERAFKLQEQQLMQQADTFCVFSRSFHKQAMLVSSKQQAKQ